MEYFAFENRMRNLVIEQVEPVKVQYGKYFRQVS
jgi:predicted  nucleic acid-binding Zn-ribbon protein